MTVLGTTKDARPHRAGTSSLVTFYLWAFGISWLGFLPILAGSFELPYFHSRLWLGALILPAVGPAVAAAIAGSSPQTARKDDSPPLLRLRAAFLKSVSTRWWAVTVLFPIGVMLTASLLTSAFSVGHPPRLHRISPSDMLLFSLMSLAANPLEEIGWRGFAQTRLQETYSALTAASIVGFLWAAWHIPLFFLSSNPVSMSRTPFWAWAAGVVPQAILLAWLYNHTERSLATVSVFHILGNLSGYVLDPSTLIVSTVRIVGALLLIWKAGPHLGRSDTSFEQP